ncbi:MAG: endonuclease III [Candidatus Liptonbacteria bacterium]
MNKHMTEKQLKERKLKFKKVSRILSKLFPRAKIALNYKNNWELLVAVQLSAQCTDKKVNEVTAKLFKKYRKLDDYMRANQHEFEKDIYETGFYRNKARNILKAAKVIKEQYGGKLPHAMEEIKKVPGVGRKSANVILGNAYGVVEGIAVDTHVMRLARVLGLSSEKTPEKIEQDLMKIVPRKEWLTVAYRIIDYGRKYCPARPHKHELCPLIKIK